jgi:hypothetical protein
MTSIAPINPQDDLRNRQILPGHDPRLQQTQQQVNSAAQAVAAGPAANQYTQQGGQVYGQAVGAAQTLPGYSGSYGGVTDGRQDAYTQAAGQRLGAIGGGAPMGGYSVGGPSAAAQQLTGQLTQGVGSLYSAPNRGDLASQQYQLMQEQYQPRFEQDLRQVGQKASALGRIGAGMTTSDLGDVAQRKNEFFGQQARQLSMDAAQQEMADRLNRVGATQGALGTVGSQDQGWAGLGLDATGRGNSDSLQRASLERALAGDQFSMGQALRGEEAQNRNFNLGLDDRNVQFGQDRTRLLSGLAGQGMEFGSNLYSQGLQGMNSLAGLEGQQFGQGQANRNEYRGERGYQGQLEQQAMDDWIQQQMLEEQLYGNQFGRDMGQFGAFSGLGFGDSPESVLMGNAGAYEGQAQDAYSGAGDLLGQALMGGLPLGGLLGKKPQAPQVAANDPYYGELG